MKKIIDENGKLVVESVKNVLVLGDPRFRYEFLPAEDNEKLDISFKYVTKVDEYSAFLTNILEKITNSNEYCLESDDLTELLYQYANLLGDLANLSRLIVGLEEKDLKVKR